MNQSNQKRIIDYSNEEVIERHLKRYNHSPESVKTRSSAFNYFFDKKYFGFNGHISEISKSILIDYFDWLNGLNNISLNTKTTKWRLLKSLIRFCMEYYDDFLIKIPSNTIKWKLNHKTPASNKDIVMEIQDIVKILDFLKVNHFTYYLIFRIFAETGMRKGELINIDYNKVKFERRYIDTQGKRGRKVYYISQELADYLKFYFDSRKLKLTKEKALFLSTHNKRYSKRQFNVYLKSVLDKLNINKEITCKTFRSTLNTLRYEMGCPNEERKILLNHKVQDVNINHYLKLNYEQYLNLFDKWYPYQEI